jgi:hypothetical protein
MPIRLIHTASFDPETTQLLAVAYERARCPADNTLREALAKRIIQAATLGERDLEKLIAYGLGRNDPTATVL